AGDDPKRLANRVDVDACRRLLGHAALQEMRDAAAELDHLEPARDLAQRVREHLAVLARKELRDLLALLVEELADREEELRPLRQRQRAPGGERLLRGLNGLIDLVGGSEVDGARLLSRGRVEHRPGASRSADVRAPAD